MRFIRLAVEQPITVSVGIIRITFGQRLDPAFFLGIVRQIPGFVDGGDGGISSVGVHRRVDIRTEHESLAPVAHRTLRIVLLGSPKRA